MIEHAVASLIFAIAAFVGLVTLALAIPIILIATIVLLEVVIRIRDGAIDMWLATCEHFSIGRGKQ